MPASSLGYVVVEATTLAPWRRFAVDTLGLMAGAEGPEEGLRLRVDERPFRMLVLPGKADRFVAAGWEFPDREQFETCLASLRAADVKVEMAGSAVAADRCVSELARCVDPSGNALELYWGRALDYASFASPRGMSGFVTGNMGMGHVVLPALQLEACRGFYKRHLGCGDTDEMWLDMTGRPEDPRLGIYFLHAGNPRHHSLGLMGGPAPSGCVHIMLEARTLDDVGRALDRCMANGMHISSTLGKHSNDLMVSFYVQTPGGFDVELGWSALQVDWAKWVPTHSLIPDLWGHRWTPPSGG